MQNDNDQVVRADGEAQNPVDGVTEQNGENTAAARPDGMQAEPLGGNQPTAIHVEETQATEAQVEEVQTELEENIEDGKPVETQPLTAEQAETPPVATQAGEAQPKKKNVKKEIISWILTLGTAVVIALLIRTFLFEPIRVDGSSMSDTLVDGEIMFVTKPEYLFGDPQVGDVVICRYPGRTEYFVKRLMGTPGDVIEVRSNMVYRNGEAVGEPYLTPERNDDGFGMEPFTLGENEYFVMGDNRDNSHDSRNYYGYGAPAALTRDQIIGHVRFVLFPFDKMRGIE